MQARNVDGRVPESVRRLRVSLAPAVRSIMGCGIVRTFRIELSLG